MQIATDAQHVHTKKEWDGAMVLKKAASLIPEMPQGKVLIDTVEIDPFCKCTLKKGWKTWLLIYYLVED